MKSLQERFLTELAKNKRPFKDEDWVELHKKYKPIFSKIEKHFYKYFPDGYITAMISPPTSKGDANFRKDPHIEIKYTAIEDYKDYLDASQWGPIFNYAR